MDETEREIRAAIEFHLEGLRREGYEIPTPTSSVEYIEVAAQQVINRGRPLRGRGLIQTAG